MMPAGAKRRLAVVVSHPIQYYAPLYQRLARRDDIELKVFFTWHAGERAARDRGFGQAVSWDVPLTQGYAFEAVRNVARDAGTHHFFGLRNPSLLQRLVAWNPDVVHVTGWAWHSHLMALRGLRRRGIPTLFRGDSHLLGEPRSGLRWQAKRSFLKHVYAWPHGFLVVGSANRKYYEAFGVDPGRLFDCPHSIDVARFAEPSDALEQDATEWREELGVRGKTVLLFAGKFEPVKRPLELMQAVGELDNPAIVLIMVGSGELSRDIDRLAQKAPQRFRVLPFQNQSRMPVVYRLADAFVLPSASETWGIAVSEALACGRPVVVSDRVGCAADVVDATCGTVFCVNDPSALTVTLGNMLGERDRLKKMQAAARARAWLFDVSQTEAGLLNAIERMHKP